MLRVWLESASRRSSLLQVGAYLVESASLLRRERERVAWRALVTDFASWQRSLRGAASPLADEQPWITFGARHFLERVLTGEMAVFEYGAGGSSLFLARRVRTGFSVEHDAAWSALVTRELAARRLTGWQVQLIEPGPSDGRPGDPGRCEDYTSGDLRFSGRRFREYAASIDRFADGHFDLVLLDGRARPSCFRHAVSKVKRGGYLLLDNAERPYYQVIHDGLPATGWQRHDFPGPGPYNLRFWRTCIWQRR
jgi:hypothetical protein